MAGDGAGRSLWRHGDFRSLWAGQTISEVGSQVTILTLPLVAIDTLRAGAFAVGALVASATAPYLVAGLPAGALVDRWRKRRVMLVADAARLLVLTSVPLAWWAGVLGMAQLYVVALVSGVFSVFFDVAYQTYVPTLVGADAVVEANSKLQASTSAAQVGGPAVGGLLVGAVGAAPAVGVDAGSFLVSIASLLAVRTREQPPQAPAGPRGSLTTEIAEGLRFVAGESRILALSVAAGTANFSIAIVEAVLLLWLRRTFDLPADRIGLLLAAGCAGGIVGAALAPAVAVRFGLGRALLAGVVLLAVGNAALPLCTRADVYAMVIGGQAAASAGAMVFNVNQVSIRQTLCPPDLLGRVNASVRTVVWGALPLGALAGAAAAATIGLRAALWMAVGVAAVAIPAVLTPALRHMLEMPVGPVDRRSAPAAAPGAGADPGAGAGAEAPASLVGSRSPTP